MSKQKSLMDYIPAGQEIELPYFEAYIPPLGYLPRDLEAHALFFYYLNARRTYEEHIKEIHLAYEGDKDSEFNFQQLFESIAFLFGVAKEKMANYWDVVDAQCGLLNLPKLPNEGKYRFNGIILVH